MNWSRVGHRKKKRFQRKSTMQMDGCKINWDVVTACSRRLRHPRWQNQTGSFTKDYCCTALLAGLADCIPGASLALFSAAATLVLLGVVCAGIGKKSNPKNDTRPARESSGESQTGHRTETETGLNGGGLQHPSQCGDPKTRRRGKKKALGERTSGRDKFSAINYAIFPSFMFY